MVDYVLAEARGRLQNRFIVSFIACIDKLSLKTVKFDAVIDTGCTSTKLSFEVMGKYTCSKLQEEDIKNYKKRIVGLVPSYGVTDVKKNLDLANISDNVLRTDPRLCFKHSMSDLMLHGGKSLPPPQTDSSGWRTRGAGSPSGSWPAAALKARCGI